ncbi:flagellar FlbD family protein [Nocardioides sp.]|uniref:flagellar FlbD family protein n=1 Tax=Nocardioides sp. TaxID=35761 RepID=UPI002B2713C6|nr:flagellar FlbD family protein [Nocardioides sp.]
MIPLTRLSGSMFVLNSDLIERVDSTPDTVITLVDGSKYLVAESLTTVLSTVRRHRAEIVALGGMMAEDPQLLSSLTDVEDDPHARNLSLVSHRSQQETTL